MRLKCVHVPVGKRIKVPEGYAIHHSSLIEPKKGEPYFSVLLTDTTHEDLSPAIGFKTGTDEDDDDEDGEE